MFTKDSPIWHVWSRLSGAAAEAATAKEEGNRLLQSQSGRGWEWGEKVGGTGIRVRRGWRGGKGRLHLQEKHPREASHLLVGDRDQGYDLLESDRRAMWQSLLSTSWLWGWGGGGEGGRGWGVSDVINTPFTFAHIPLFKPWSL